jgi:hypothetical protein
MTMTLSVFIVLIRNTGEGRLNDSKSNGNNDSNSGSKTSFGTFAIVFDNAIK